MANGNLGTLLIGISDDPELAAQILEDIFKMKEADEVIIRKGFYTLHLLFSYPWFI